MPKAKIQRHPIRIYRNPINVMFVDPSYRCSGVGILKISQDPKPALLHYCTVPSDSDSIAKSYEQLYNKFLFLISTFIPAEICYEHQVVSTPFSKTGSSHKVGGAIAMLVLASRTSNLFQLKLYPAICHVHPTTIKKNALGKAERGYVKDKIYEVVTKYFGRQFLTPRGKPEFNITDALALWWSWRNQNVRYV